MSLLEKIKRQRLNLTHTDTIVKTITGDVIQENRTSTGDVTTTKLPIKSSGFIVDMKPDLKVDKIIDRLFMGSQDVIQDIQLLNKFDIKCVLSVGVYISEKLSDKIEYFYVDALDIPEFQMVNVFHKTFDIIYNAINIKQQNVFVHCNAGVSRSASVIIAYLIKSKGISYIEAYEHVKSCRSIIKPNEGFLRELKLYEKDLNKK